MGKKARQRNRPQVADKPLLVIWQGESYQVADKVGDMALMRFAKVADQGIDSNEMAGLAAMYDMLASCLIPADWKRFETHALRIRAQSDEIMDLVKETYQALSGRPTRRPSSSADGPRSTVENSGADSSSQVMRVIDSIPPNRPDLKLAVWEGQAKTG